MTTPAAPGCPVDESFDPLAPDFLADPYAVMAALSNQGAPLFFAPSIGYYIVTRYRDIEAVFHDPGKALVSSRGSCWSRGAPIRAVCAWTAQPLVWRVRRGARPRAPALTGRAWPTPRRRLRRRRSPVPTSSKSSARNYPSILSAPHMS